MNVNLQEPQADALPPIVLLVEDDADTSEMFQTALKLGGLWVASVRHSNDTLDYAFELRPNAVVIDFGVRGVTDGLGLAAELRRDPRTADVPIVAVVNAEAATIESNAEMFADIFGKPVPLDRFVLRVRSLIEQGRVLRERSERARAKVPDLIARSDRLIQRAAELVDPTARVPVSTRHCPKCRSPLRFSERRELEGVLFDYYTACPAGCGLYCYDNSRRKLIALIE